MPSPVGAIVSLRDSLAFAIGALLPDEPTERRLGVAPAPGSGASGEAGSLEERFERLSPDVARLCRQLLGDPDAAGDALSEVFLRARRGWDRYDPARPFRTWLLSIASHYCIDQLRRRHREQRIFEPDPGDVDAASAPGPSPLRRLLEAEQRRRLEAAIDALPPRYRAPLVLRFHAELSYDEIAAQLGLERPHVGTLLLRARRKLRETLTSEEGS